MRSYRINKGLQRLMVLGLALALTGCAPVAEQPGESSSAPVSRETPVASAAPQPTRPEGGEEVLYPSGGAEIVLADGGIRVTGSGARASGSVLTISAGGTYTLSGTLRDGQIVVDAPKNANVKLVLQGVDVACSQSAAINCRQADHLLILLADGTDNKLSDGAYYVFDNAEKEEPNAALFSKCDLEIEGNGTLAVNGRFRHGIATKDDLRIQGGIIEVNAPSDAIRGKDSVAIEGGTFTLNAGKDGISATNNEDADKGWVSIGGGSFTITASGDVIQAETALWIVDGAFAITTGGQPQGSSGSQKGLKTDTKLVIENGTFRLNTADDAIHAGEDATINGGDFHIETKDDGVHADRELVINGGTFDIPVCYEGLEGTQITVNGGKFWIDARDDAIGGAAGTAEARGSDSRSGNPYVNVYINGGEIEAVSVGDTIDSNGDIHVTGGKLRLSSPARPYYEGALLCNGTVRVSGGDIALVGNVGVELTVENQPMLFVSHPVEQTAGSVVSLRGEDGSELLSVTARKNFIQSVFSSPELEVGKTYAVYIDDVKKTEVTLEGMITKAAEDGGEFTGGYPRGRW